LEIDQTEYGDRLFLKPAPSPAHVRSVPDRPLVYATLGTAMNTATNVFRDILTGLSDEPVDVIVTVGRDRDPDELEPIPPNARVERFIPQADLLSRCAVVVHHGGAGTTFGCFTHGVPQVVIPQGADNFINAAMVERAGVGLTLLPDDVNPTSIRDAVVAILRDGQFEDVAGRIADEIALMPDSDEVAQQLRSWLIER
jgi:MGT family glycosyltransferase